MRDRDPDWFRDSTIARWLAEENREQMLRRQRRDDVLFDLAIAVVALVLWLVGLAIVVVAYA